MKLQDKLFADLKKLRKKYSNIEWIIEHCYGEEYYVCDAEGVCTGEHHGKEWGELWYEKYGKYLNFDDVNNIVNAQFEDYFHKNRRD